MLLSIDLDAWMQIVYTPIRPPFCWTTLDGLRLFRYKVVSIQVHSIQIDVVSIDMIEVDSKCNMDRNAPMTIPELGPLDFLGSQEDRRCKMYSSNT